MTQPMNEVFTLPRAMLFDMDGTLTRPLLDFPRIKAEMGIGSRPILEALAELNDTERRRAEAVLHRHEEQAAANSTLNEGCQELLEELTRLSMPTALITRNSRRSVETVLALHGLSFPVLVTREDGRHKPHPEPLLRACAELNVAPSETWMIGDGQYDVEAGNAAGAKTVWISHDRARDFAATPWRVVSNLHELTTILRRCHSC
jgi:HAD superfamily hydrolase (TIGR01509 family)